MGCCFKNKKVTRTPTADRNLHVACPPPPATATPHLFGLESGSFATTLTDSTANSPLLPEGTIDQEGFSPEGCRSSSPVRRHHRLPSVDPAGKLSERPCSHMVPHRASSFAASRARATHASSASRRISTSPASHGSSSSTCQTHGLASFRD